MCYFRQSNYRCRHDGKVYWTGNCTRVDALPVEEQTERRCAPFSNPQNITQDYNDWCCNEQCCPDEMDRKLTMALAQVVHNKMSMQEWHSIKHECTRDHETYCKQRQTIDTGYVDNFNMYSKAGDPEAWTIAVRNANEEAVLAKRGIRNYLEEKNEYLTLLHDMILDMQDEENTQRRIYQNLGLMQDNLEFVQEVQAENEAVASRWKGKCPSWWRPIQYNKA